MHDSLPGALIPVLDGLPGPWGFMALLLFLTFIIHLLLMNALVGVAVITLVSKLRILLASPSPISPSREHSQDLLLPKGVALVVNFGIPPFLFMQCIYSQYIYPSSVLMAPWWLSVMLVVMLAYYGTYINMTRRGLSDSTRTAALGIAVALLLFNAFLFVNNMTLLQNPEQWTAYARNPGGSFLNLADPQLLPRYLHVILSCLAVGGLCLALPEEHALRALARKEQQCSSRVETHMQKRRKALRWFMHASLLQIPAGLWFFMALEKPQRMLFMGGSGIAAALFMLSLAFFLASLILARKEKTYALAMVTVFIIAAMAGMRFILRQSMLEPYYNPQMRALDAGPLLLFIGSLALSAVAMVWLGKVYWRHKAPGRDNASVHGRDAAGPVLEIERLRERETLLVLEIAGRSRSDDDDDAYGTKEKEGDKA